MRSLHHRARILCQILYYCLAALLWILEQSVKALKWILANSFLKRT